MSDRKFVRDFLDIFVERLGPSMVASVIRRLNRDQFAKVIRAYIGNDLEVDNAVDIFINSIMPPKLNLSIDLVGNFNNENEVKDRIIDIVNKVSEDHELHALVTSFEVNSAFPLLKEKIHMEVAHEEAYCIHLNSIMADEMEDGDYNNSDCAEEAQSEGSERWEDMLDGIKGL